MRKKTFVLNTTPEMDTVIDTLAARRTLALDRKVEREEVIVRAVAIFDYLNEAAKQGKEILLRDRTTGEATRIIMSTPT